MDIVEQLRETASDPGPVPEMLLLQAADEIEALRVEVKRLRVVAGMSDGGVAVLTKARKRGKLMQALDALSG